MDDQSNRENGVYYTPSKLADYLASPLIEGKTTTLFDPAYGEGALLLAAERAFKNQKNIKGSIHLFGCDKKPVNGLLKHLPKANLKNIDFFNYPMNASFDVILMNPPYVRHQLQDHEAVLNYRDKVPELKKLNFAADLWAYFMIKSIYHLKEGGCVGAILPWALLQADYARPVREWLSKKFKTIRVLALNEKYFDKAEERVILLWLRDYGKKCDNFEIASAKYIDEKIEYKKLPLKNWTSDRVCYVDSETARKIIAFYRRTFGFSTLDNFANVRIGVVTGADKFFIKQIGEARELGFRSNNLTPIITSTKQFPDLLTNGLANLKRLILIKKRHSANAEAYIKTGVKKKFNSRAHSRLRNPWYEVKIGKLPDGFFPYRISKCPCLLLNEWNIQCTNSVHRIYFKKLTIVQMKWVSVSLLSNIGLLSLEANSKTYGRGMLKIEPGSLNKALALKQNDLSVNEVYDNIVEKLKNNNRQEAVIIATNFIDSHFKIPPQLSASCSMALQMFQNFRLE